MKASTRLEAQGLGGFMKIYENLMEIRRGSASRRVDALNYPTNPPNLPKPQTSPQGGGFTLPLPPPYRSGPLNCSFGWRPPPALDPSKSSGKTNEISTFSVLGPTKAPYTLITLAIYGLR